MPSNIGPILTSVDTCRGERVVLNRLKVALLNGLAVLLPLLFFWILLREFFDLIVGLATPIADLFPRGTFEEIWGVEVVAALLIVAVALLLGFLAKIPPVRSAGSFLEDKTLNQVPVYRPLKYLLHAILGSEDSENFKPALFSSEGEVFEPCYLIEDTGRSRVLILVPWTPTSFAGSIKAVPREWVYPLALSFDEFSLALTHFGVGLTDRLPETGDLENLARA